MDRDARGVFVPLGFFMPCDLAQIQHQNVNVK